MPYKSKEVARLKIAEKRTNPAYKEKEKLQRQVKMSTPEEKKRRSDYKKSEKGKEANKKYKQSDKGKITELKSHLKRRYGLTIEEFNLMLTDQNNNCKLCNKPLIKNFVIDHCHDTMNVRGVIHQKCNMLIGFANDDINMLQQAIDYLTIS